MAIKSPENNISKPEAQKDPLEVRADSFRNKAIRSRYVALASFVGSFATGYTSYNGVHKSVTGPIAEVFNNPVGSAAAFIATILAFNKAMTSLTDAGIYAGTSSELRAQIEGNNLAQQPTVVQSPNTNPLELDI